MDIDEGRAERKVRHEWNITEDGHVRCDMFGCYEWHPLDHESLGDESFGTGRWLGWLYLDLNRPDLYNRPMRFCSVQCCALWLERQAERPLFERGERRDTTALDRALRRPSDEVARRAANLGTEFVTSQPVAPPGILPRVTG